MQSPLLVAASGTPTNTAAIRTTVARIMRPAYGLPMDGDGGAAAGGDAGAGAAGTIAPPAPTGGETGQAPGTPATGAPGSEQQQTGAAGSPLFDATQQPPAQPGHQQTPGARPGEQPGQPGYQQSNAKPAAERSLDEFPPEIRDYVRQLRQEAGDNRVKARTAEDAAAEKQREWLDGIAKVFGLIEDTPEQQQADPEVQAQQLTEQLTRANDDHRATKVELAIWQTAHDLEANPRRLANARDFMSTVAGLDPGAADFPTRLAAAIKKQVEADPYYKADPGPAPVVVPPVPSGGDFAGGPSGGALTDPQSVDEFRESMRKARTRT